MGLLGVAVFDKVRRCDVVVQREAETTTTDIGSRQLVGDNRIKSEVVASAAAVRFGNRHTDETMFARLGIHLAIHDAVTLPLFDMRRHLRHNK